MKPNAKLIACTTPTKNTTIGGATYGHNLEEFIAYCARVSNPGNQGNHDTSAKLIQYLASNAHWSPFEMAHATIEILTTRDIARQILRHRSFSFQEFSQRYGAVQSFVSEGREARLQDNKNRQNSIPLEGSEGHSLQIEWSLRQSTALEEARKQYEWALNAGIAKEVARSVLPEGLTTSRLYMAGTIRSWIHYIQTRTHPSTQKEHREVALLCAEALKPQFAIVEQFVHR